MPDGDWTESEHRSFEVMHNAESNDLVLWGDRKEPLEVTGSGLQGESSDKRYILAKGPAGGGPYKIEERYDDDGRPNYYNATRKKAVSDLRFVERWHEREDSEAGKHLGESEFDALVREVEADAMEAFEYNDYEAMDDALADVISQRVAGMDTREQRGVLVNTSTDLNVLPGDPDYNDPDPVMVEDVLTDEWRYREFPEHERPSVPRGQVGEPAGIEDEGDYDRLVAAGVAKLQGFYGKPPYGDLESFDQRLAEVTEQLLATLTAADYAEIVAQNSQMDTSLFDGEDALRQTAKGILLSDIDERFEAAQQSSLRSKTGAVRKRADDYVTSLAGHDLTWDDLTSAWGMNLRDRARDLNPPLLADGGGPHTLVDEINQVYGEEVVMSFNNWMLDDPGIVDDGDTREMAWWNTLTDDRIALVGWNDDAKPAEYGAQLDKWTVWYHDAGDDGVEPVFSSDDLIEAKEYAEQIITEGEEADVEVQMVGEETYVKDDLDEEAAAEQFLRSSGFSLAGHDIPMPTRHAGATVASGAGTVGRWLGSGLASAGRAAGRGAGRAGRAFVSTYKKEIASAVGYLSLFAASRVLAAFSSKARYAFQWDEEKVGWNVGMTSQPEDSETGRETNVNVEQTWSTEEVMDTLGLAERFTWVLGEGADSDEIYERIRNADINTGVMPGDLDDLNEAERERLGVDEENTRKTRDLDSPSSDGGSSSSSSSSSQSRTRSSGGKTVGGSSSEEGEIYTDGTLEEMWEGYRNVSGEGDDGRPSSSDSDDDTEPDGGDTVTKTPSVVDPDHDDDYEAYGDGETPPMGTTPSDDAEREEVRDAAEEMGVLDEEDRITLEELEGEDRTDMVSDMHGDEMSVDEIDAMEKEGDRRYLEQLAEAGSWEMAEEFVENPGTHVTREDLNEIEADVGSPGEIDDGDPGTDYDLTEYEDWDDDYESDGGDPYAF